MAKDLHTLQLVFDTCWMVSRAMGLNITVKADGKKTAWSGTYWKGGVEKQIEGWEIRLPNGEVVPQVEQYKYLGGEEKAGWRGRHEIVRDKVKKQCCRLLRLRTCCCTRSRCR